MTIIKDYLELTEKYKKDYGEKTLLLMQVGSFFECYALINEKDNTYIGSNIKEFSDINDLVISRKHITHNQKQVVMAGFGLMQIEKYIRKMQENDYTIVVYTQDSNTKNTARSLSCIYSPGTYFSNDTAELSNVTCCIWIHYSSSNQLINEKLTIGMSSIDIYTGKSNTTEYSVDFIRSITMFDFLENYLNINNPSECVIISNYDINTIKDLINCKYHVYDYENEWIINTMKQKYQYSIITNFFNIDPLNIFTEWNVSTQSYCLLIQFIYNHNPNLIKKLLMPTTYEQNTKLILANHSLKQLNIITDNKYSGKYNSVSSFLNNCVTNMGKRAFHYSILNPLIDTKELSTIYDITEYCMEKKLWKNIRNYLGSIKDLSKIYRKIVLSKLSPKDFYIIYNNLTIVNELYMFIIKDEILNNYINYESLTYEITNIQNFLYESLNINNCVNYDDLNFEKVSIINMSELQLFNSEYSMTLNKNYENFNNYYIELIKIRESLDLIIKDFENNSKEKVTKKPGIKSPKELSGPKELQENNSKVGNTEYVKFHECPKTEPILIGTSKRLSILKKIVNKISCNENLEELTDEYLVIKNKYLTEKQIQKLEIKTHNGSNSMVTSNEINEISRNILKYKNIYIDVLVKEFQALSNIFIDTYEKSLNNIIDFIIKCDLLQNRCYIAETYNYCKPEIVNGSNESNESNESNGSNYSSFMEFKALRHPLIERINTQELYVPNDLDFNEETNGYILYGTNAVGKTSFIKSIGIAVIIAQAGIFVPAEEFKYSVYKSIYTRILGNDNLFKGLSTFAVEMTELRSILKNANQHSLVLGDELCSGTETTSALSIFTAGVYFLAQKNVSFIFASHFHEVIKYEEIENITNLKLKHMSVEYNKEKDILIYDRKLKDGPGNNMYGLEVCKALNLPDEFLEFANDIRNKYLTSVISNDLNILSKKTSQYNAKKIKGICQICNVKGGKEVHHLIYQKDANESLYNKSVKNHTANLINICEECHDKLHSENKYYKIYKTSNGYEII